MNNPMVGVGLWRVFESDKGVVTLIHSETLEDGITVAEDELWDLMDALKIYSNMVGCDRLE